MKPPALILLLLVVACTDQMASQALQSMGYFDHPGGGASYVKTDAAGNEIAADPICATRNMEKATMAFISKNSRNMTAQETEQAIYMSELTCVNDGKTRILKK